MEANLSGENGGINSILILYIVIRLFNSFVRSYLYYFYMKLAIIGDFRKENKTHLRTDTAIRHSLDQLGAGMEVDWIGTDLIPGLFDNITRDYHGFLIAPGSPYANMQAVLDIIRFARTNNIPVLGTCGGFQHMVVEFVRNVLGMQDADHAETNPQASKLVIHSLQCSLAGETMDVQITDASSRTNAMVQQSVFAENYYCNFGLNPAYQEMIHRNGFRVVATDAPGEVRVLELAGHPFFIGTLFVPQMRSTPEVPHPIVTGFIKSVLSVVP